MFVDFKNYIILKVKYDIILTYKTFVITIPTKSDMKLILIKINNLVLNYKKFIPSNTN